MKLLRTNLLRSLLLAICLGVAVPATPAVACPMCKAANEEDDARPRAYMYSILFMIGMPAMLFCGFGLAFYRVSRQQADAMEFEADKDQACPHCGQPAGGSATLCDGCGGPLFAAAR